MNVIKWSHIKADNNLVCSSPQTARGPILSVWLSVEAQEDFYIKTQCYLLPTFYLMIFMANTDQALLIYRHHVYSLTWIILFNPSGHLMRETLCWSPHKEKWLRSPASQWGQPCIAKSFPWKRSHLEAKSLMCSDAASFSRYSATGREHSDLSFQNIQQTGVRVRTCGCALNFNSTWLMCWTQH